MEIANNNLQAILSGKSPSQRSGDDVPAEDKNSEGTSGFDGALLASMMPGATQQAPKAPMTEAAKAATNPNAGESIANAARSNGSNTKGIEFPDVKRLLDTKSNQSVNGTMSDVFVAGPNSPWKSDWVFGANKPAANANSEKLQGIAQALAQLQAAANDGATGGDESQLSQIQSAIAGLDGQLTQIETDVAKAQPSKHQLIGGAEYLNMLSGAQSMDGQGAMNGQGSGQFGSNASDQMAARMAAQAKGANANRANLQVVQGGVTSGTSRLDSVEKFDDSNRAPEWTLGVSPQNIMHSNAKNMVAPVVISGNVVPGSMMRDRLTSDSILNVSSGISKLNASGGGEMRIRLNPENLGELTIHVATNGQDVGLKVHASSGGAKKILEESMNSLRESLATQNLMLGRVDVSVLSSNTQSDLNGQSAQNWAGGQNAQMDLSGNSTQGRDSGGNSRYDRDTGASPESRIARAHVSSAAFGPSRARAGASSSRLDVMA